MNHARTTARFWSAPVLWRFGFQTENDVRGCPPKSARGLAHSKTLSRQPDDSALIFSLAVRGDLRPDVQADGRTLAARFEVVEGREGCPQPAASPDESERGCVRNTGREDYEPLRPVRWTQPRSEEGELRLAINERGARYLLTIDPIAQQAYLKASNTGGGDIFTGVRGDYFGGSVAVSGDTIVVGTWRESSNATGVNGNQSDNSAKHSSGAYIFTGLDPSRLPDRRSPSSPIKN